MQTISDFIYGLDSGHGNITINTSIYNIEAIHTATYQFTGGYHILIAPNTDNSVMVIFEAKSKDMDIEKDIKDFANALIDHQVRHRLDKTNGKIRELIVAHAFSPLDLQKETNSQ